ILSGLHDFLGFFVCFEQSCIATSEKVLQQSSTLASKCDSNETKKPARVITFVPTACPRFHTISAVRFDPMFPVNRVELSGRRIAYPKRLYDLSYAIKHSFSCAMRVAELIWLRWTMVCDI